MLRQRATYSLAASHQTSTNLIEDPPYTPHSRGSDGACSSSPTSPTTATTSCAGITPTYQADWRLPARRRRGGTHLLTLLADWDGERATARRTAWSRQRDRRTSRNNFGCDAAAAGAVARGSSSPRRTARRAQRQLWHRRGAARLRRLHRARSRTAAFGDTSVKASAPARGIKEPTLLESFSLSPFCLGNPDLEPERSRSVDVGMEQRLADDRAQRRR